MNKPRIARLIVGALLAGAVALPAAQVGQAAAAPSDLTIVKVKISSSQTKLFTPMSKKSEGPWP